MKYTLTDMKYAVAADAHERSCCTVLGASRGRCGTLAGSEMEGHPPLCDPNAQSCAVESRELADRHSWDGADLCCSHEATLEELRRNHEAVVEDLCAEIEFQKAPLTLPL